MIARIWKGRTPADRADEYVEIVTRTGIAAYRSTPGNRGAWLLRRIRGEVAEFQTLTLWDSFDAIRSFAGPEPEKAVYYPEDETYLLEKAPEVEHYEVLVEQTGPAPGTG